MKPPEPNFTYIKSPEPPPILSDSEEESFRSMGGALDGTFETAPNRDAPRNSPVRKKDNDDLAILVAHGMGQQLPFATLDQVATIVRNEERRSHPSTDALSREPRIEMEYVVLGRNAATYSASGESKSAGTMLPRAEIQITRKDGTKRCIHLYEMYWAPLTEGRITLRETTGLFLDAGVSALRTILFRRTFSRYIFMERREMETISFVVLLQYLLALLSLLALIGLNALIASVVTLKLFASLQPSLPTTSQLPADPHLPLLTAYLFALECTLLVLFGIAIGLPMALRKQGRKLPAMVQKLTGGAAIFIFVALVLGSLLLGVQWLLNPQTSNPSPDWIVTAYARLGLVPWLFAVLASFVARGFLLQFLGDVAIYVSPQKLNRFYETRRAVQEAGAQVARAVYAETDENGDPRYPHVVIVGHSLGSVLAYDTLNALIQQDNLGDGKKRVTARTKLLLTFGSPLDKIAFIFGVQPGQASQVREQLASAGEPLTVHSKHRPRWINIWSRQDWISNRLRYYDKPEGDAKETPSEKRLRVENFEDEEATTPLAAHNEYWDNRTLAKELYKALTDPYLPEATTK